MGAIYATLAVEIGWTYPEIDELTMADVVEIQDHWAEHPPLSWMVAAYLGVGKRGKGSAKRATKDDLMALAKQFGGK